MILVFIVTGGIVSSFVRVNYSHLDISYSLQKYLVQFILLITVLNIIINLFFGHIPLLHGSHTKHLVGQNSRLLFWLSDIVVGYALVLLVFTKYKGIKKYCVIIIIFEIFRVLLYASKGVILDIVKYFIAYHFLMYIKTKNAVDDSEKVYFQKVNKKFLRYIFIGTIVAFLISPLYLMYITKYSDPIQASLFLIRRLFGGFDQLFLMLFHNFDLKSHGLSLFELYFLPFLKVFKYEPLAHSSIDYFINEILGISDSTKMMTLPNPNLIMDVIFSNGVYLGTIILVFFSFMNFYFRKRVLSFKNITLFRLIMFKIFVMNPLKIFLDAQNFFVGLILSLLIYFCYFIFSGLIISLPKNDPQVLLK